MLWYGPNGLSNPPAIIKTSSTFAWDVKLSRDCSSAFELSKLRAAKWGIGLKPSSCILLETRIVSVKLDPGRNVTFIDVPGTR